MFAANLVDWVIRASLLLAVGLLIARILEFRSATMAHRSLVATIACVLMLPIAAGMLPTWNWVTPAWMSIGSDAVKVSPLAERSESPAAKAMERSTNIVREAQRFRPSDEPALEPFEVADQTIVETRPLDVFPEGELTPAAAKSHLSVAPAPLESAWTWAERLAFFWIAVSAAFLGRVLLFIFRLYRFVGGCSAANTETTNRVAREVKRYGLNGPVRVLYSFDDAMPMACWLGRWIMVLPANFLTWPDDVQRATLVHELGT